MTVPTSSSSHTGAPQSGDSSSWTLVTVTHNSARHLVDNWGDADIGAARWLVIDNASTDDSVRTARDLGAEVLQLPANIGFSAANNRALAEVRTAWTMFVNPDVRVPAATDLGRLAAASTTNGGAIVAPQLLNSDGTEQANARGLPFLLDKIAHRILKRRSDSTGRYTRAGLTSTTYVAWVMGAAVGGPTEGFRSMGGWDERFFLYYEDHDLGLRAWRSGRPVVVVPTVRWPHEWQRETVRLSYTPWAHELRSMRTFYRLYPSLLSRRRLSGTSQFAELRSLLWTQACPRTDVGPSRGAT